MSRKTLISLVLTLTMLLILVSTASGAPSAQEEMTYTVKLGDNLWTLAEKYLGSGPAYWAILGATNAKHEEDSSFAYIENPNLIHPGWKLLIPPLGGPPQILSFTASPSPADPTGTITLSWNVRGASSVTVQWTDKNMNDVAHSQLPLLGSLPVALSGVKFSGGNQVRFNVLANDANGQLMVDENNQAIAKRLSVPLRTDMKIASFTASPDPVERGGTVTLTWDVRNASSVSITRLSPEGIFLLENVEAPNIAASGSMALSLPEEYVTAVTYYLGASDANGVILGTYATVGIICRYDEYIASECPLTHDYVPAAYEPFEGGHMVWRGDTREVYVLYDDGSYETYPDTWNEGEPINIEETPPQGLLPPVRGFGKLWTSQPGVRDRLGWPTTEEIGYAMLIETVRVGRHGLTGIYFDLPDNRVVYLCEFPANWEILP
ncbi:MAG: LysM peptidoglycan-binding domain-containing protein [Anaerolineae bacterium]